MLFRSAGQSDKKVTIAYDPMFRAVMNMIQNAVEHTKENGIIYIDAIRQIKDQNLEYETSCSGIKEFDDCLSAIDDMRDALRESLEKQWKTEQEKKQQMSALAHDIKTPLTIVRGNAELLSETELTTEQKKNITYVLNGTTQIQSYVKQLIDVTKSWNCSDVTYTTVRLEDFFADIKEQALGLVEIYHQKIDWKAEQSDKDRKSVV